MDRLCPTPGTACAPATGDGLGTPLYPQLRTEAARHPGLLWTPSPASLGHTASPTSISRLFSCGLRPWRGSFLPSLTHQRPFLYPLYFHPSKWGPLKNSQLCASRDTNPNTRLFEEQLCQLCAPKFPGQLWGLKTAPRAPSQEGQAAGLTLLPVSSSRLG